ncbi:MAG: hypothetical protein Q9201_006537 [Fulgogasparrea decipioides]
MLGSNANCSDPERQSLDEKEVPCNDTTAVHPEIPDNDDCSAIEGATEQMNAAETMSLDASHSDATGGRSQDSLDIHVGDSLDVLVENHRDSFTTMDSSTAANMALPESVMSTSSVHEQLSIPDLYREIYSVEIERLRTYIPHLQNVQRTPRVHHRAKIHWLDFNKGQLVSDEHTLELETAKLVEHPELGKELCIDEMVQTYPKKACSAK